MNFNARFPLQEQGSSRLLNNSQYFGNVYHHLDYICLRFSRYRMSTGPTGLKRSDELTTLRVQGTPI